MKYLKATLFILTLVAIPNFIFAQLAKDIVISISITEEMIKDVKAGSTLYIYNELLNISEKETTELYPIKFKDGQAEVIIRPKPGNYYYWRMDIKPYNFATINYIIKAGDSLYLDFKGKGDFSHRSNSKLFSCQREVEKLIRQSINYSSPIDIQKEALFEAIGKTVDKYSEEIDGESSQLLKINAQYEIEDNILTTQSARSLSSYPGLSVQDRDVIRNSIKSEYVNRKIILDSFLIKNSSSYSQYLLDLEKAYNGIIALEKYEILETDTQFKSNRFDLMYQSIQNNYKGILQCKLFSIFFLTSMNHSSKSTEYLKKAELGVKVQPYSQILKKIVSSKSTGQPVFPFSLECDDGKFYSLDSFKGKIIVAEFYFNGCTPCAALHKFLEPFKDRFREGKDVVFLNIAVDNSKKIWMDGVKTGKYTSSNDINLYIGIQAFSHPLFTYYNYTGCPQLLLIDRQGNLISANPNRPTDQRTLDEFELIINKHL